VCSGLENDDHETAEDYRPRLIYCAGAIADLYKAMGGEVLYAGKPYRPIYELAYARLKSAPPPDRVLAIGDSLRTDLAGANSFGVDFVFLTAGIHAADFADDAAMHKAFGEKMPKAVMQKLKW
jgi:ribonucleotide monophosphatase NagD (HAD superfamily)